MELKQPENMSERTCAPSSGLSIATEATDLNRLLKKVEPWVWGPVQQVAHDGLKGVFNDEGMVLRRIECDKQLILDKDFSNQGLGVVLGH